MISTVSVSPQSLKSGSSASTWGSVLAMRFASPPTAGCFTAKYAAANAPVIATPNWMKSVTITPHSPDVAANAMFSTPQTMSVCGIGQPSTTLAILTAARFTEAMMKQLKSRPR